MLDGDTAARGAVFDLGFSDADGVENVRRAAAVARKFLAEKRSGRDRGTDFPHRRGPGTGPIISLAKVFMKSSSTRRRPPANSVTPKVCMLAAPRGQDRGFTGIDAPYEAPATPALRLETAERTSDETAAKLATFISDAIRN
nr:adenylyl-sulfate kinase [Komagataeibacter saccharivorans]